MSQLLKNIIYSSIIHPDQWPWTTCTIASKPAFFSFFQWLVLCSCSWSWISNYSHLEIEFLKFERVDKILSRDNSYWRTRWPTPRFKIISFFVTEIQDRLNICALNSVEDVFNPKSTLRFNRGIKQIYIFIWGYIYYCYQKSDRMAIKLITRDRICDKGFKLRVSILFEIPNSQFLATSQPCGVHGENRKWRLVWS